MDGLRYTDKETMEIVQQVLCGRVNKNIVSMINKVGEAVGLCGMDGGMIRAAARREGLRTGGRDRKHRSEAYQ